jgi:hypothetical protein
MDGDSVLVAPGTYSGDGNTNVSLLGKRLLLAGGGAAGETTIDGGDAARAFVLMSGEPSGTRITRFTFFNCNAPGDDDGGAIFMSNATARIDSCVFRDNRGGQGGALCVNVGEVAIERCVFGLNTADQGGAVWLADATATVNGCVFYFNVGLSNAAAIGCARTSLSVTSCTVVDNFMPTSGGGILGAYDLSTMLIDRTLVGNNFGGPWTFDCNASTFTVSCSDVVLWGGCLPNLSGQDGNISIDPMFCYDENPDQPYALQAGSPCLPGNHPDGVDCGLIGALGVGCGGPTAVERKSWGAMKALFR